MRLVSTASIKCMLTECSWLGSDLIYAADVYARTVASRTFPLAHYDTLREGKYTRHSLVLGYMNSRRSASGPDVHTLH
jgi:hypothetical protein